jgi:dolichyl-phosphate beta-glucosyltransferase
VTGPTVADEPWATEEAQPRSGSRAAHAKQHSLRRFWRAAWPSLLYVIPAIVVLNHLLFHPLVQHSSVDGADEYLFEWIYTSIAQNVVHLHNPMFATSIDATSGVNLMANTGMLLVAVPFTPITLLWGAPVSIALVLTLNLAAAAAAWRWFFNRHLPPARDDAAADSSLASPRIRAALCWTGGLVCGFGPGMIAHSNGHPNLTALWLVPLLIDRALRLARSVTPVRDGVLLGVLAAAQILLTEEILFLLGLGLAVFIVFYCVQRPSAVAEAWRSAGTGLLTAAVTVGVLVGYPLWFQFKGPQSYGAIPDSPTLYSVNAKTYLFFPAHSIAGNSATIKTILKSNTEQAALIGWPLLILFAVAALWLVRDRVARAITLTLLVLAVLSWGPSPKFGSISLSFHGPWYWLQSLPLFHDALPIRLSLLMFPFAVFLIATAGLRIAAGGSVAVRTAGALVTVAALVPLIPLPFPVAPRAPLPAFITAGEWNQCLSPGQTLATVPFTDKSRWEPVRWVAAAKTGFDIPMGSVWVPGKNGDAQMGPDEPTTVRMLNKVDTTGHVPKVTPTMQAAARADFASWDTRCVAVLPSAQHAQADAQAVTALLGPGRLIGGAWTWKIAP